MQVCSSYTGRMRASKSEAEHRHYKALRDKHFILQRAQRLQYYKNREKGVSQPEKYLSIICDAMDQGKTQLPIMRRRAKNDKVDLVKQKVMGVMVHGWGTFLYVAHSPLKLGVNFVLECVWRTLLKLNAMYTAKAFLWPAKLKLQFDNASDNKAYAALMFFAILVKDGVFTKVTINFLMVGHTHEDIDQYFSVIARRLNKIVYSDRSVGVYSLEDFTNVVMSAFKLESQKPKCVELVRVNHDFVTWCGPEVGSLFTNITKFRSMQIRRNTPTENADAVAGFKALPPRARAAEGRWDGKIRANDEADVAVAAGEPDLAVAVGEPEQPGRSPHCDDVVIYVRHYMSYGKDKRQPAAADLARYGPSYMCCEAETVGAGEPQREEFSDLTEPTKLKSGGVKSLPTEYVGLSHAGILSLKKRHWLRWVQDPAHGATTQEAELFEALLQGMLADVDHVPAAAFQKWRLPAKRAAAPLRPGAAIQQAALLVDDEEDLPDVDWAYGKKTAYQAGRARKEEQQRRKAAAEMVERAKEYPLIKCLELLVIRSAEENDETGLVETHYELVQSRERVEKDVKKRETIEVQYMYPEVNRREAEHNDFNGTFRPWFIKSKSKRGELYGGNITRAAIVVSNVTLTAGCRLTKSTRIAIAQAQCGFTWNYGSKRLDYDPLADGEETASEEEEGAGVEEEEGGVEEGAGEGAGQNDEVLV
jgi:hypothetical protein